MGAHKRHRHRVRHPHPPLSLPRRLRRFLTRPLWCTYLILFCFLVLDGFFIFALRQQIRQVWRNLGSAGEETPSSPSSPLRALETAREAEELVAQEVEVRREVYRRGTAPPPSCPGTCRGTDNLFQQNIAFGRDPILYSVYCAVWR